MTESTSERTVLIVDDDEVTLQTYATCLMQEGYVVRTASSPAIGWQELEGTTPDAIILDLRLPEASDGLQFLRDLRARDRGTTPVAVVTGDYGLDGGVEAEIRALDARLVFKPFWL
jgi:DNA-binding response OmpR family regulator